MTLNREGQELVDLETLIMLCSAMTSYLEPIEAIRLVLYDSLLLFETLGWTQPGWIVYVKDFPTTITNNRAIPIPPQDLRTIPDKDWITAFKHLKAGVQQANWSQNRILQLKKLSV